MERLVAKIAALAFAISIVSTALFWLFLSDSDGLNDEGQQAAAAFISENYQAGDIVFPTPDWDLGFTRYLSPKVSSLLMGFSHYTPKQLRNMVRGDRRFFVIFDKKGATAKMLQEKELTLLSLQTVGNGEVALVEPLHKLPPVLLDFSRDIMKAKRVYFSDKNGKEQNCAGRSVWQCSHREWNHVGFYRAVMGGVPQDAIWAHPLSQQTLHVKFNLPDGAQKMELGTAFLTTAYQKAGGDAVKVRVLFDEKEVLTYLNHNKNRDYRHNLDVPAGAKEVELQFFVNNDGARHFVFNGFVEGR